MEEKKELNLKIIIPLTILVIYLIVMVVIFLVVGHKDIVQNRKDFIVLDGDTIYSKEKEIWVQEDKEELSSLINNRTFYIFSNEQYVDTAKIKFERRSFYYDSAGRYKEIEYPVLLYSAAKNTGIEVFPFKMQDFNQEDYTILKNNVEDKQLVTTNKNDYSYVYKVEFDFDNDGSMEKLLFASTTDSYSKLMGEEVFNSVLYVDGSSVKSLLYNKSTMGNHADAYEYSIRNIVKFEKNDNYTIIFDKYVRMGLSYCYTFMEFDNSSINELGTCKEVS